MVISYLKIFTFLTKEEIEELEKSNNLEPEKRLAHKALAREIITDLHGKEEYEKAEKISQVLFSGKVNELTSNEIEIAFKGFPVYNINERLNIVDILVKYEICSSKREAREFITTGSISINGNKITELDYIIDNNTTIDSKYVVIRKGKKKYFILKY